MKQKIKFPRSEKVYLSGSIYPELRVAMRKVEQIPSTTFVNEEKVITPNRIFTSTIPAVHSVIQQ